MQGHRMAAMAVLSVLALSDCKPATPGGSTASAAATATPPTLPPKVPQALSPGMDDLMTMLVTPRHLRLYYAGTRHNWELAAFEAGEIRSALRRVGNTIPLYQGRDVEETVGALLEPRLAAIEAAIADADAAGFTKAFAELTAGCNACHTYLEHPYLVIKVPDAAAPNALPNQDFRPTP